MSFETIVEGIVWFASMMSVAGLSFLFSYKLGRMHPEKAAMPKINSLEGRRLFFILGMNYSVVAVACVLLAFFSGPKIINEIDMIVSEWWLVEIFIFFNIITSYCLYTASKRVVINV